MQTTASQHQQSKLSSSVVRTLMKTGAIHVELVYICFYSNDGEILKSSRPCPPSAADPKSWSGTVQGIQVITCSLSWSLAFSKCSRNLRIYKKKFCSEHPSDENCREARVCAVVFVLLLCNIFPSSLHCIETKARRPYDHKFSGIKEEGGLQCGNAHFEDLLFNEEALNVTTMQVFGRCHGKDNGSLMVFFYGDRKRKKKKKTYCTGGPWPQCLWWPASHAAPRLRLQTRSEEERGDS